MDSDTVTLPAPAIDRPLQPQSKWEREYEAFRRLLPQLMHTHLGKYVVIHEGQVVDSGDDALTLAERFFAQHGNVSVHIGLVSDQPARPVRIPHYRVMQ